tara:strand:- start:275 stop:1036 length:762 start_codon:yes stop_codon:yes gene_type:complete
MAYLKKDNLKNISISIVCHNNHIDLRNLLNQLENYSEFIYEIIVTYNVPETRIDITKLNNNIILIHNSKKKGFGENHNFAFEKSNGKFFCILNPDISINENIFYELKKFCDEKKNSIVSPIILGDKFTKDIFHKNELNLTNLISRYIFKNEKYKIIKKNKNEELTNWLGGMFLFCDSNIYRKLHGFDENFFLYCEDVDLCLRARKEGIKLFILPNLKAVHQGKRSSHKKTRYLLIHLKSLFRFAIKHYSYFFK